MPDHVVSITGSDEFWRNRREEMKEEKVEHLSDENHTRRLTLYKKNHKEDTEKNVKGFFDKQDIPFLKVKLEKEVELEDDKGKITKEKASIQSEEIINTFIQHVERVILSNMKSHVIRMENFSLML